MLLHHLFFISHRLFQCTESRKITLIESFTLVYCVFIFEKNSFVIKVDILDKNEMQLGHIIATGGNPEKVRCDTTPNPNEPIKIPETIINTFFLF